MMKELESLGSPLAVGRTAEIFLWDAGKVIKLFRPGWEEAEARWEAHKAGAIHTAGLPVPAVFGVVEVNGRYGILYERLNGISFIRVFQSQPWKLFSTARWMADIHHNIHRCSVPHLPSVHDNMIRRFQRMKEMPEDVRQALFKLLDRLPKGEAVCHGDFHPENIFLNGSTPFVLDWMDAARGSPLADVARTSFLLSKSILPVEMPNRRLIGLVRNIFHKTYLERYFHKNRPDPEEWKGWQTLVAAARLAEDVPGERDMLIGIVRAGIRRDKWS
jgi:uncharacterized protein (TIGR02172 family)